MHDADEIIEVAIRMIRGATDNAPFVFAYVCDEHELRMLSNMNPIGVDKFLDYCKEQSIRLVQEGYNAHPSPV